MSLILAIPGSLRKASFNRALAHAAVELAPEGHTIEVAGIEGIPLYNADEHAERGVPEPVAALKDRAAAASALLLVTPEYNNSIPGVFKNAIDWLSRPPTDIGRVFRGKLVGLIGATPGRGGTILSQVAWLQVLRALQTVPWFDERFYASGASKLFDADGKLTDEPTRTALRDYLAGFAKAIPAR